MSKSIGIQLHVGDPDLSIAISPEDFHTELSSISSPSYQSSSQPASRLTPFQKHMPRPHLAKQDLSRTTYTTKQVKRVERSAVVGRRPSSGLHSIDVTLKPASALHRIRTVTSLYCRKKDDFVENFWQGRSVLNRLMLESVKERQKIETLTALRLRAEEQRSASQLHALIRKKQQQEIANEAADRRKMMRSASELDIKRQTLQDLQSRGALRCAIRAKRVQPQSVLSVHSVDVSQLPPARLLAQDLHVFLSAAKIRRFRFK